MAYQSNMERNARPRSGIAHGGIGTGGIELRKDGIFSNWGIFNNKPFGTGPRYTMNDDSMMFFKVRWQEEGGHPRMKLLQIETGDNCGAITSQPHYYIFPWMTGIEKTEYSASFPYTNITFRDNEMPFDISVEVLSPFIPHDVKNSSLPGLIMNFEVMLKTERKCDVMVMTSLRNCVGYDTPQKAFKTTISSGKSNTLVQMSCDGMKGSESTFGTMSLCAADGRTSYYAGWEHLHPYYEIVLRSDVLPNINDTDGRNNTDQETNAVVAGERLFSTVASSKTMSNREIWKTSFIMSWDFPNFYGENTPDSTNRIEGHYHNNFFNQANEVAEYMLSNKDSLERETRKFHNSFFDSSIDEFVLDQVNSNMNTFVSSGWLTKEMNFGINEGLNQIKSWGPLATTDVGMYGSVMPAALFPELDKNTFRIHSKLQDESGEIMHGIQRNFAAADKSETVHSRLDMPSQFTIQALRTYFWTNDKGYLAEIWPHVKKTLDYVLNERDHNQDNLPDMEGAMCSYDNFPMFGAASYIASQWLSALQFAIEGAKDIGDTIAMEKYKKVYESAKVTAEEKLWNGKYFRLYNDIGGKRGDIDEGCLTDQIIGQWASHMIGGEDIYSKDKILKALGYVIKKNTKYYGLVNCSWPEDEWLHAVDKDCWNDQANTCWTGVELGFAALLIYEGLVEEGLAVIKSVDDRQRKDDKYFDHPEFGGHYYRPMSAYSIINAILGLHIRGTEYTFAPKTQSLKNNMFFSLGNGYAHFKNNVGEGLIRICVEAGSMVISKLTIASSPLAAFTGTLSISDIPDDSYSWEYADGKLTIEFKDEITLKQDSSLQINML